MKRMIFIVFLRVVLIPALSLAGQNQQSGYDYTMAYDGRFKSTLLFQRDDRDPIWRPTAGPPNVIGDIRCAEALSAMRQEGVWTGNLSGDGNCLGNSEAPERTYGNYLNYLYSQTSQSQTD